MSGAGRLWTVGHSSRSLEDFVALLVAHRIGRVVDVRTLPRSRRHPWFDGAPLGRALIARGLDYRHAPDLGGLRRPRAASPHTGWHDVGLRGYADHMETPAFTAALDALIGLAHGVPTAAMCAEADPARCHRTLLADALLARGVAVEHIVSAERVTPHRLTAFARRDGERLIYAGSARLPF